MPSSGRTCNHKNVGVPAATIWQNKLILVQPTVESLSLRAAVSQWEQHSHHTFTHACQFWPSWQLCGFQPSFVSVIYIEWSPSGTFQIYGMTVRRHFGTVAAEEQILLLSESITSSLTTGPLAPPTALLRATSRTFMFVSTLLRTVTFHHVRRWDSTKHQQLEVFFTRTNQQHTSVLTTNKTSMLSSSRK